MPLPLWQLANALWRRKWTIFALAITGGLLAVLAGFSRTSLYEASASIVADLPNGGSSNGIISDAVMQQTVDDHLTMLVSRAQLRRAIGALRQRDNTALVALQEESTATDALSAIAGTLDSWVAGFRGLLEDSEPITETVPEDPDAALLDALSNGLRVGQELNSRVVTAAFVDHDPALAARIVNITVQTYVDYLTEQSRASIQRDLAVVNDSIPVMERELTQAVDEKERYLQAQALGALAPDATSRLSRLRALELRIDAVATRYNDILARRETLRQRAKTPLPGVSIVSLASPQWEPLSLPPIFFIPPGMVMFGLLGAFITLVLHRFDDRIRGETDAEYALGISSAGILPRYEPPTAQSLRDLLLGQPQSPHGRAASSILISLVPRIDPWPLQVLLVTAPAAYDGKTELAWSLALSASRLGQRVLLIDFDIRQSPLTRSFQCEFGNGKELGSLADLTEQKCSVGEAVERMPEIGVDFLIATADSTDIFSRFSAVKIRQGIEKLTLEYDLVILNGPTVIAGPQVRLLAALVDDVLFAIQWNKTRQRLARAALELLHRNGRLSNVIRIVLTEVDLKKQRKYWIHDSGDLLRAAP